MSDEKPKPPLHEDPRVLAFVEALAALYADLWHADRLEEIHREDEG